MNEMNVEWTSEDSSQANLEGWDIFECRGSDSGPWQIQKIDDAYIFDSDIDVWKFICKRDTVFGLTELHRKALSFIKQKNKEEYKLIMNEINKIPETNKIPTFISDATQRGWKVSIKKDDPRGGEYGYYDVYIDNAYPELIRIDKLDADGHLEFPLLVHPDYFYNWSIDNT